MHSLSKKLTLAFLFISLFGIFVALIIIQQRTSSEFDRFLSDRFKNDVVSALIQHYDNMGSWEGAEQAIRGLVPWKPPQDDNSIPDPAMGDRLVRSPFSFLLMNQEGVVQLGIPEQIGRQVSESELERSIALESNGEIIGWILFVPGERVNIDSPEKRLLGGINQAILIGGLTAVVTAFFLGATLTRALMRPINELSKATKAIAQGDLGYQVDVRSKDELGELAHSFNQMSSDLAKSNQLRRQMTADIAHDLRTPVSVILGYAEALSDGKLEGSPEIFSVIYQETGHLSHLIDDLRVLSLADARELPLNLQEISPNTFLNQIAVAFKPQALHKMIDLIVETEPELPVIQVDPDRMAQVLGNLVSNAFRYTQERGWVKLEAESLNDKVVIRVRDNGSGIAEENLSLVFTRFYRGDSSRQQNGETGLGLTIAKALVEAQGGTIGVNSTVGFGTTFSITLPVRSDPKLN